MGLTKSTLNKLCTCNSQNDCIDTSNVQKCRKRNINMLPKLSPEYNTTGDENSAFEYESTPCSILLNSKTIDLLMQMDDLDSISPQKMSKPIALNVPICDNKTEETDEKTFEYTPQTISNTCTDAQKRIETISNTTDIMQLKQLINDHYSFIHSNQSSYQSSFSLKPNNDPKANIYRDGTNTPWTDNDIEELTFEMHQQLHNLINNDIIKDTNSNDIDFNSNQMIVLSDEEEEENIPSTNLYRDQSGHKWTKKTMDIERKQMKKAILHLALTESRSIEKDKIINNSINLSE